MAGATRFSIAIDVKNAEAFSEIAARFMNIQPAYEAFVETWAKLNQDIFGKSAGLEASGAQVDPDVFWEPLSAAYRKAKRSEGYPDHLMVATGALMQALTNPDMVFQSIGPQDAIFGSPLDIEDVDKVRYNWYSRQTVFFSIPDQRAFKRILKDYLTIGEGFQEKRFSKGMEAVQRKAEAAQLDADFENATSPDSGDF